MFVYKYRQEAYMQTQGPMLCTIENEKILRLNHLGQSIQQIGVITSQYEEALKVAAGYKEKLIEAGIIKKERTPQELHDEQMAAIQALLNKVNTLEEKVKQNELRESSVPATEEVVSAGNN